MQVLLVIRTILKYRRVFVIGAHLFLIVAASYLAFWLRFDGRILSAELSLWLGMVPWLVATRGIAFIPLRLYEGLWRYTGIWDLRNIIAGVSASTVVFYMLVRWGFGITRYPRSVFVIDSLLLVFFMGGIRLGMRSFRESSRRYRHRPERRALIVGAGDAGDMLVREIGRNLTMPYEVVGFVDDEPRKRGMRIHGVEVLGTVDELSELCRAQRIQEVLIAIPSANGAQMRRISQACRAAGVEFKTIPSLGELLENPSAVPKVRRVDICDLLRREPVRIDHSEVEKFVRGKGVLITGAGGSIGSELCRQVARFEPGSLVLLDRAENTLFFVELEIREKFPELVLQPVIADVTDEKRIRTVFKRHKPQVVFHAAAHKHVPLMELNKAEAVKNNVLGTMVVADSGWRCGVEDLVFISTDKAVRPSSIMGATKRLAEMYVQALSSRTQTRITTVRFGNVLGSDGSVLQVFQRQIEAGGPITITHPDMKRYFMTIPEACQLVLQAATQGKGGEIFVLDMGNPVSIVDLAKDLIVLAGLDPERDVEIKFTGPRPGEKLFEELLGSGARILPTSHEKIMIAQSVPIEYEVLETNILDLVKSLGGEDDEVLIARMMSLVPDYLPADEVDPTGAARESRILLIEDDPCTRATLRRILEGAYEVSELDNGHRVLQQVKEQKPDLVILDFHLPQARVRRMCAKIKQGNGKLNLPIILLTESADSASLEQVLALGADDRVYRPIRVDILEKRIKNLLNGNGPNNRVKGKRQDNGPRDH
jgi:FlaA1/EpsC-like NDP-sugar epimerase